MKIDKFRLIPILIMLVFILASYFALHRDVVFTIKLITVMVVGFLLGHFVSYYMRRYLSGR